jgi:mono/diheme cytochrome c family protein
MIGSLLRGAVLVGALGVALGSDSLALRAPAAPLHFVDADDRALVTLGRHVYAARCASCHGRSLQGQPLWQLDDDDRARRAPALDATGHGWFRDDDDLFRMVAFGGASAASRSAMPAFAGLLDERQILAVVAFVKARWPIGLRAAQAMRNPGSAGMPADAARPGWRFPPTCISQSDRISDAGKAAAAAN